MKIDGKKISQEILNSLKLQVEKLKEKNPSAGSGQVIAPTLAIIIVGENPASLSYVRQKELKAKSIGIETITTNLSEKIPTKELIKTIQQFNDDDNVHGIIVQQPLPQNINLKNITNTIDPQKDVDGFHPNSKFQMPIAIAVLKILEEVRVSTPGVEPRFTDWLRNKNIVIFGKGETGGKPIINALQKMGINPSIIDSKTEKPKEIAKKADIIISAVGKSNIIDPKMLKQNVILIGIGQHKEGDKMIGDFDEEKIKNIASFYTPTPGGVGPIDVSMLLKNLVASVT
jgi:methylenetetrahydrofolate dehydrogenase (NADP+) / methenyltetrahydrofolate cyclohydrolase